MVSTLILGSIWGHGVSYGVMRNGLEQFSSLTQEQCRMVFGASGFGVSGFRDFRVSGFKGSVFGPLNFEK